MQRLVLETTAVGRTRDDPRPTTGRIRLTVRDGNSPLKYGNHLVVQSRIRPFRNFVNPGGFDYARFMKYKGLQASLYSRGEDLFLEPACHPPGWTTAFIHGLASLRNAFSQQIHKMVEDAGAAALLEALVLGNRWQLSLDLQNMFARSGASHILAISGLHLSIVATLFFFLFRKFLSLFTPLLIRGLARKGAALMTLVPLAGYALISGFSPATQRAFVMVSVVMVSLVMERESITLNALAAAAIVILLLNPAALFSISFQLSFAAVVFIVSGLDLARRQGFPGSGHGLVNKAVLFFLVSVLAIAGTQPLVMRYFNMASPAGVFTNIVTIPVVGFGVLPLGLVAFLVFPLFPTVSSACLVLAGKVAMPCILFLDWVCELPGAWVRTVTPGLFYVVAWYLFMGGVYVWFRSQARRMGLCMGITAVLMVLVQGAVDVHKRYFTQTLDITMLDVGQGNSALIRLPGGACFLVDGGGFSSNEVFDTGRYLVAPFLWRQHILTLNGVVLTHPDADHMNGLLYILENFRVKVLYKNADQVENRVYERLMELTRSRGIGVHQVDPGGEDLAPAPDMTFRFLPGFNDSHGNIKTSGKNFNNNALVLRVGFRRFSMLFAADIMALREAQLVDSRGHDLKTTLLMVPHHGSNTSSTAVFLDQVQPEAALISCGWHNRFRFPHSRVVKRYEERNIPLYRTDRDGALRIVSNGITWRIETTR
jgi:competence protein ComEC